MDGAPRLTEDQKAVLLDAYGFLKQRDRLSAELLGLLERKGHRAADVESVVQFLIERKLINDDKTTQHLIENKSGKRSVGIEKLRAELEKLGAPADIVERSLMAVSEREPDRALEALRAKYKAGTDRAKAGRFLYSRGFDEDSIETALDAFCGTAAFPE